jgi:hypothetical protein
MAAAREFSQFLQQERTGLQQLRSRYRVGNGAR